MQRSLPNLPLPGHEGAPSAPAAEATPHRHVHNDGAFDRVGAVLGFACAVHCVAVPLLFAFLPAFGLGFLADTAFDLSIVAVASIFALLAARSGWRAHRDPRVLWGFIGAIALLVLGLAVGEEGLAGRVPSILGGSVLAVSHIANLRLSKRACAHSH